MVSFDHLLDAAVAAYSARRPLFVGGPGDEAAYEWAASPVEAPPAKITLAFRRTRSNGIRALRGRFESPAAEWLPREARMARVELLLPNHVETRAVCVYLAASGEQGLGRRRLLLAGPLLARGIGAVILENAFYGRRRPAGQRGGAVRTVSELGLMARSTLEEARALLAWLEREGFRPAVSGVSMGGQVAAMAAATVPFAVAAAPLVPSRTPAPVFCDGELRRMVCWDSLRKAWGDGCRDRLRDWLGRADVLRLPVPVCTRAAVIVGAAGDAILPSDAAADIHRHWPGSELRIVASGHIGAVAFHSGSLRRAIRDAVARLAGIEGEGDRRQEGNRQQEGNRRQATGDR